MIYYIISNTKTLSTNMLESLVIHNNFITAIKMKPIADMKYQLHQFNLNQCFINQGREKIAEIYVRIYVLLIQLRYMFW